MPDRTEYATGVPNWVDLQTSDQEAAKAFYASLFGWVFEDMPMGEGDGAVYSMGRLREKYAAAIAPLPPQQPMSPHWNSYIAAADVDAVTRRVEGAGGVVLMQAFDVMDAGRMSFVADPAGAPFGLWQAKNHIGAEVVNEPGAYTWNELHTPGVDAAAAFYASVLGWEAEPFEGMDYTVFNLEGAGIAGATTPSMPGMPPSWLVYFDVADADATATKAKDAGGSVLAEPADSPAGPFAVLADPQGAAFGVIKGSQPA